MTQDDIIDLVMGKNNVIKVGPNLPVLIVANNYTEAPDVPFTGVPAVWETLSWPFLAVRCVDGSLANFDLRRVEIKGCTQEYHQAWKDEYARTHPKKKEEQAGPPNAHLVMGVRNDWPPRHGNRVQLAPACPECDEGVLREILQPGGPAKLRCNRCGFELTEGEDYEQG